MSRRNVALKRENAGGASGNDDGPLLLWKGQKRWQGGRMTEREEEEVRRRRAHVGERREETKPLSINTVIPASLLLPGNAGVLTGCTSPPTKKSEHESSVETLSEWRPDAHHV